MFSYNCAKCGNNITYDENNDTLLCAICKETIDCSEEVEQITHETAESCPMCGAQMTLDHKTRILKCEYCDTTYFLEAYFKKHYANYDEVIPFGVNTAKEERLDNFLLICDDEFAPSDFKQEIKVKTVKNVFVPIHKFEVKCDLHYTLEVGQKKTRKRYNKAAKKYEDEYYTEWSPMNGNLSTIVSVVVRGFDDVSNLNLGELEGQEYKNILFNFSEKIIEDDLLDKAKKIDAIYTRHYPVIRNVPYSVSWEREGVQKFNDSIEKDIRALYKSSVRGIRYDGTRKYLKKVTTIFPITLLIYDYKEQKNQLLVLDGVDGTKYSGNIPLSNKKIIKIISQWLIPIIVLYGTYEVFVDMGRSSGWRYIFGILGIVLAFLVFAWIAQLKGTGGDPNSDAAHSNKETNMGGICMCGLVVLLMAIVAMMVYC